MSERTARGEFPSRSVGPEPAMIRATGAGAPRATPVARVPSSDTSPLENRTISSDTPAGGAALPSAGSRAGAPGSSRSTVTAWAGTVADTSHPSSRATVTDTEANVTVPVSPANTTPPVITWFGPGTNSASSWTPPRSRS